MGKSIYIGICQEKPFTTSTGEHYRTRKRQVKVKIAHFLNCLKVAELLSLSACGYDNVKLISLGMSVVNVSLRISATVCSLES